MHKKILNHFLIVRKLKELYLLSFVVFTSLVLLYLGVVGDALFQLPVNTKYIVIFFKEALPPFIVLMVAWYIALTRRDPVRQQEMQWLFSLPVKNTPLCLYFYFENFFRFIWVWIFTLLLVAILYAVAPPGYLARLAVMMLLLYIILIQLHPLLHLNLSVHKFLSSSHTFPQNSHPIMALLIVLVYCFVLVGMLAMPACITGQWFAVSVFSALLFIGINTFLVKIFLEKWQFIHFAQSYRHTRNHSAKLNLPLRRLLRFNPLLLKRSYQLLRRTGAATLFLTALFMALTYLVSMNNPRLLEALYVLYYLLLFYTIFIAFRLLHDHHPASESKQFLYSLPVRRPGLYFSLWVPAAFLTAVVFLVLVVFVFSARQVLSISTFMFYGKTWLSAQVLLLAAVHFAMIHYPDHAKAQKRYTYWILLLIVLSALFYPYRFVVAIALLTISAIPLFKVRFFGYSGISG
ncbi:hypothetical protein GF407_14610 [candidate division KSB1 bacterium]|nr:hypothetical protein [candidate division KSB1 bacterium]